MNRHFILDGITRRPVGLSAVAPTGQGQTVGDSGLGWLIASIRDSTGFYVCLTHPPFCDWLLSFKRRSPTNKGNQMTKQERAKMIRDRFYRLFGVPLTAGLLSVSRVEIQETAQQVHSQTATDDSIIDEETDGVLSQLQFDPPQVAAIHDSETVLSARERQTLAREMALRRTPASQSAALT